MTGVVQAIGKIGGDKARNYLRIGFDESKSPGKDVYARCLAEIHDDHVIGYYVELAMEREYPQYPIEQIGKINSVLSNEILRSLMDEKRKKYVRGKFTPQSH